MPKPPSRKCKKPTRHVYPRSLYPEPGQWLIDLFRTTGKVEPPDDLPHEPLTVSQVRDYVSYEGLGFCIWDYLSPEKISDKRLAELWRQARAAMLDIINYMDAPEPRKPQRKTKIGTTISQADKKG